jgi:chromosome segregation protein
MLHARMHLRAIKLRGFKSFPDPIEVRLEPGVAVVVGPNGSGKSNIADGLVWAAGTLAPSDLRAERPDDVLFAGSASRPEAAFCEVELLFDNSDGALAGLDFSEVSIARRLHRGGEGQYLVNGTHVRRLDVVELLADIGLGTGTGSVVGQGRVEAVLASRPEERRALVEEAAGLGKFKRRRHRAELKLQRVAAQVERARDVEAEVQKRLRPLALQATAAERAEKLAVEIAGLKAGIAALDLASLTARRAAAEERQWEAQGARARADVRLEQLLAERTSAEEELADAAGSREAATAALYRLRSAVERLALRREPAQALAASLDAELAALRSASPAEVLAREQAVQEAERTSNLARAAAGAAFAGLAAAERAAEEALLERLRVVVEERAGLEGALTEPGEDAGALLVALRGATERLAVRSESPRALASVLEHELAEAERLAAAGGPSTAELEAAAREAEAAARRAVSERDRLAEQARSARERLAALEQALSEREGIPPAARALAEAGETLALSLLAVEPGYERAVAAALAWRASALVADDPARALALLERARADGLGGLAVLVSGRGHGSAPPFAGARPLAEVAGGSPLLDGFWLVDRGELLSARSGIAVTVDGLGYDAKRGELWLEAETPESLLLELDARRRALEAEAAELTWAAEAAARDGDAAAERARAAAAAYAPAANRPRYAPPEVLARMLRSARRLDDSLAAAARRARALEAPLGERAQVGARRSAELGRRLRSLAADETELRRVAGEASARASAAERESERYGGGPGDSDAPAEELRVEAERRAGAAAHAEEAVRKARDELERHAPSRVDAALLGRIANIASRHDAVLAAGLAHAERFEAPLRAVVDAGAGRVTELGVELQRLGAAEVEARRTAGEGAEALTAIEVELARLDAEKAEAARRLADANAEPVEGDADELAARLERLERRREQLGGVNPFAKEEYAQEKERLSELSTQREDLEQSLAELEKLRDELAETVERRFGETFAAVRDNFAEVAATLFPGGEGRLSLTDPDEGDEPGIEVELRPAGKKVTRLSLLSGGEKSLGAIAFLFALFLARPCPFYLLDEVEAALDDTNIGRFVELLRRFSDRAQFVVITHQKRTMEAADLLYGVTMGADGVSQVVSRRLSREHALTA